MIRGFRKALAAADVASRLRDAADQADAHKGDHFELAGWEKVADHSVMGMSQLLLEAAIRMRLKLAIDPYAVGNWLRDAADLVEAQKSTARSTSE